MNRGRIYAVQNRMGDAIQAWEQSLVILSQLGAPEAKQVEGLLIAGKSAMRGCLPMLLRIEPLINRWSGGRLE